MDITKLYQKQISLTEWFEQMGHPQADALRREDNDKRERLRVLNEVIGLPFDKPYQFPASELAVPSAAFKAFLAEHGQELCALRLIPTEDSLPKLRMRGHTVNDAMTWFAQQQVDPAKYKADFVPHAEHSQWSTIFVVNRQGIFGEIIRGGHHQLTQGFHDQGKPVAFALHFQKGQQFGLEGLDRDIRTHLEEIFSNIKVDDTVAQKTLADRVNAIFSHNYLCGYFETASSQEFGLWFIDYNRLLGNLYQEMSAAPMGAEGGPGLKAQVGSAGLARGRVRHITPADLAASSIGSDEVLVCAMTTPDYMPLMRQAAAIVTEQGGILSHAAIVARELKKPCLVGLANATGLLKEGDMVEVDATRGIITKIL